MAILNIDVQELQKLLVYLWRLPDTKGNEAKLNYLGRVLAKMSEEGLLRSVGRTWYITDMGENEIRV